MTGATTYAAPPRIRIVADEAYWLKRAELKRLAWERHPVTGSGGRHPDLLEA